MCGISGFVDSKDESSLDILKLMTNALQHRGPDDGGFFYDNIDTVQLGLGHRRLSIFDLSSHGHQPMEFCQFKIIFNGEIYNFKEIRCELESLGYSFESDSDTEVLLKSWHAWGRSAIDKFNGMFAFAVLDMTLRKLTLVRDRAGVKPLYWYQNNGLFMFSSELKSFLQHPSFHKEINTDSIPLYLQYGYIPQPYTIYKYSHKLKAGCILELDLQTGYVQEEKYWDIVDCYNLPKLKIDENEALNETERLLKSSCEYRMMADVPVGVFLSGGYDSSLVTALSQDTRMDRVKTYSIGFHDKEFNEADYAKQVANHLGTDHTEYYCTHQDVIDLLPTIPEIWDEPFGDSSVIPTVLVSKLAREDVKVALSADGADEIFGGYDKYVQTIKLSNFFGKLPMKKNLAKALLTISNDFTGLQGNRFKFNRRLKKLSCAMLSETDADLFGVVSGIFSPCELQKIIKQDFTSKHTEFGDSFSVLREDLTLLDKLLAIDFKTYQLDDILKKVDMAAMSVGLEGREPMLDFRLVEFVSSLDPNLKIRNGTKKYLLKEITHKYIPKEIMERKKMGFTMPVENWLSDELSHLLLNFINEESLKLHNLFDVEEIIKLRDSYLSGNKYLINKIWLILMFQIWYQKWM